MVNFSLEGKVALVTGAAYGIGFAMAQALAEAGAKIAFNCRTQANMDKALEEYAKLGIEAKGYICDSTDEEGVKAMVADIAATLGPVDILVNNAGIIKRIPMHEMPAEEFRQGLYNFLKEVRQYNPEAQILYTYGLVRIGLSEDILEVISQLRDEGDEKIHYLQLTQCEKWELNLNHTVSSAYGSRGDAIIEKIREITGW